MQVFECLTKKNKTFKKAQNLIEFVFIFPILIFLTLIIFEVAFFWQEVNAIYNLNAEINANVALKETSGLSLGTHCPAAEKALKILEAKDSMISLTDQKYSTELVDGKEPFALYRYYANPLSKDGVNKPQISLWVDCRNPFEDGIITQIEFFHKTLIIQATLPSFDSNNPDGVVIIPKNIFIASPKLNTLRHY